MKQKPLKKNEPLLNSEMKTIIFITGIARDLIVFGIFYFLWINNTDIEYLRTLMFVTLGLKSLFSIFSIRKFHTSIWDYNPFSNSKMVFAVLLSATFLAAGVYFAPFRHILSTSSNFDLKGWGIAIGVGFLSIIMLEITKLKFIKKIAK